MHFYNVLIGLFVVVNFSAKGLFSLPQIATNHLMLCKPWITNMHL